MPFLGFRIDRQAIERQAFTMPKHKIKEQLGREFGIGNLYLVTSGKLPKKSSHAPNRTQPTFLVCQLSNSGN